jgi:hypothetical protein
MTLRRFFTVSIIILLLGSTAVGGFYLYVFDLNSFRTEIETLASERVSRPISLGQASLSLKHGPAFAFNDVEIGTTTDDLHLKVDKIFFRVKILPLLTGKILFSEILLENPDVSIQQRHSETEAPPFQFKPEQSLLTGELIKSLRVLNGTIRISIFDRDQKAEKFTIEKLRFSIDDFSFLHAGNIQTEATLLYRGIRSPFSLEGKYFPDKETTSWSSAFYNLKFNISNLAAKNLPDWRQIADAKRPLKGFADLRLQIEGSPEKGVTFKSRLTGHELNLTSPTIATDAILISKAALTGYVKYRDNSVDFENIKLTLDSDHGQIKIENRIKIELSNNRLTSISCQGNIATKLSSKIDRSKQPLLTQDLTVSYRVEADRTKDNWSLSRGQLTLPGIELLFSGQWQDKHSFDLNLNIPETSITSVTSLFPNLNQLRKLDLNGRFDAHLNLIGSNAGPTEMSGRLNLIDVHLAIPGPLADLSKLTGTIKLENGSITAEGLQTELGSSPIRVDLTIPDFKDPDINLHVLADSIRADELIFSSDKRYLREVDGIVRIADGTVFLGPINVKMDGGTDATVNGTVKNFAAADVFLDIEGRHGNIDEIIGLWEQHSVTPAVKNTVRPEYRGSLKVNIKTDSGQISGMQFDQATSQIVQRDETLVIGPIRFKANAGEGLGQVLIEKQNNGDSLLKISGHLTNFDAHKVYNQLLKRRGLVSGKLSGDFHLEGITGKKFLPTSNGSFAVQIKKGRLYKLTGLAKVLQVLNIYPLLTENVKGKGLPYNTITFNAKLAQGVLSTEDLLLNGDIMNLSMTGQYNIIDNTVNFALGAMPLRSVDSILSHIPIAGWLLTGSDKALVIAYFKMAGSADDPKLTSVPLDSVTTPVIGILKRVFTFPVKIITDPGEVILNK